MKATLLFALIFGLSFSLFGQEICNNAIDDDGDGLIDLNDEECSCSGIEFEPDHLIPNPSFEEHSCCPDGISQMDCLDDWINSSDATPDYYNCDFPFYPFFPSPEFPLPDGGDGMVGFGVRVGWVEYIGTLLPVSLSADTEYTFTTYLSCVVGSLNLDFTIFGTTDGYTDLPWGGYSCPVGVGSWEVIANQEVTFATYGPWQEVTLTFTPTVDINAITFGGPCAYTGMMSYYYADGMAMFIDDSVEYSISQTGNYCDRDLTLQANTTLDGGSWQWYKSGVALIGETGDSLDATLYGLGEYSAVYWLDENCERIDYTAEEIDAGSADFEFLSVCFGEETNFINTSVYGDEVEPIWQWDFGDGEGSDLENPDHIYADPGNYNVRLVLLNDACNDTIEMEVSVFEAPLAYFEFVIDGFSSEEGATGTCTENLIQFNNLSSVLAPEIIESWSWDFGGGTESDEENPEHQYPVGGTYTVKLTVVTANGCSDTYETSIIITSRPILDITSNEPTCFGFSDGSTTVNATGGIGDFTFIIADTEGNILNEDNSNTANSLTSGWYYITVSDESDCVGLDSIFLNQPDQLDIDITIMNPLCHGQATGWARVDSVYHSTGDYDQISYIWNPNPTGVSNLDSIYALGEGDYAITINDDNGCSRTLDFEITQPDSLYFSEFGFEYAYCRIHEYQSGNGVVYGAAAGGTADYSYLWTNMVNGENMVNTTWGGLNPGNYKFTVIDANECMLTQTLFLDSLNPIAEFTVDSDQLNIDLKGLAPISASFSNLSENFSNPNNPISDTTFFWNLNRSIADWQMTHDYFETFDTTYASRGQTYMVDVCLVAFNKNGCSDTACKTITVFEPYTFDEINVFSPNGDGINDLFSFEFKSNSIIEFSCVIVNRWGGMVHEMHEVSGQWDGTDMSGNSCSDGVYFYSYRAKTDNEQILMGQGTVQLVSSE